MQLKLISGRMIFWGVTESKTTTWSALNCKHIFYITLRMINLHVDYRVIKSKKS